MSMLHTNPWILQPIFTIKWPWKSNGYQQQSARGRWRSCAPGIQFCIPGDLGSPRDGDGRGGLGYGIALVFELVYAIFSYGKLYIKSMEEKYAGPRDRVFSFDSVSSINIGPSASPAASNKTQAQNVQVPSISDNTPTSDTQSTDAPSS
uniref:Uncharacterized protein n=1 Tax=Panagrolaimus davidi TaxID=227884 RepID=A0A914PE30_9BILA